MAEKVGASILNIITESLYDKPIVVFREYVQNAVDSFKKTYVADENELLCNIWSEENSLFFLDNGNGIKQNAFLIEMERIAISQKDRIQNIGYKGIGRLSGISYCQKLYFVNILSYKEKRYQVYGIDCVRYNGLKKEEDYNELSFEQLMKLIGKMDESFDSNQNHIVNDTLKNHEDMFARRDRGFLVILQNVSEVLKNVVESPTLKEELGWLLPVKFSDDILQMDRAEKELFKELGEEDEQGIIPAYGFNIQYNNIEIIRPIRENMLRDYTCRSDFEYAVGLHSFKRDQIAVDKKNAFSGIKIYIDNMLLCDEVELISVLRTNGYIDHTENELIVASRGIGAMIYITDKENIVANARRTFIEITDTDSLEFLKRMAEFLERIYTARYSLSRYKIAKKNQKMTAEKLKTVRQSANIALQALAQEQIEVDVETKENQESFEKYSDSEKKQAIKKEITQRFNKNLKMYLSQLTVFDIENAYENFKVWLKSN